MDFTDDPFRDYRYEDPFNITFDDDDDNNNNNKTSQKTKTGSLSNELDAFGLSSSSTEKFDPFGLLDGRQSVPLPTTTTADPFVNNARINNNNNNNNDNNNNKNLSGRLSAPITKNTKAFLSEDAQLAWAARESLKLEEDRKKRQLQEQADLELAISLSKAESNK